MTGDEVRAELLRMNDEHGKRTAREILVRMGVSDEDVHGLLHAALDRAAVIELRYGSEGGDPVETEAFAWLDGFMVGVSLARRAIP